MRRRIVVVPAIIAMLAIPGAVAAQACVGIPVAESSNAVTAQVGFPQDAMSYGAAFRHNMTGPFSFSAGYSLSSYDNVDPKQHGLAAEANYELPGLSFSACPTVGLGYTTLSQDDNSVTTLSIPVGFAIGKSFELSPTLSVNPFVVPQWVWTQATIEAAGIEATGDDSMLAAVLGATFATERFYVGGGLTWFDQEDVDPVFSLMAGMPF